MLSALTFDGKIISFRLVDNAAADETERDRGTVNTR